MKRPVLIATVVFSILMVSIAIVDNAARLSYDINTHTWLSLVGRWQSYEKGYYEIEFVANGTFVEYFHGIRRSSGVFRVSGNRLTLTYDKPDCDYEKLKDCRTVMEFAFDMKTLILTTRDGRMLYKKVGD